MRLHNYEEVLNDAMQSTKLNDARYAGHLTSGRMTSVPVTALTCSALQTRSWHALL